VWTAVVPPIPLLMLSFFIEGPGSWTAMLGDITWRGIGILLFIGYVATLFGSAVWSILFARYPASTVVPFALLIPIFGIGSSALLLGETITGLEMIGSALGFAGLLINVFGPRLLAQRAKTVW